MHIDLIAPPFPGHLFPLLDLGQGLRKLGFESIRVLTTARRQQAVEQCSLEFVELLAGADAFIDSIGNTKQRVGSNPWRLLSQFRMNMSLMDRLREELTTIWQKRKPNVAIVDFTVPLAGIRAQQLGIPWWTSCPTPCAIETRTATPSYLGGWCPRHDTFGKMRDGAGRGLIRTFKRTVGILFRKPFRRWGIESVYRSDGGEVAYSPEWIMGCGIPEFEFDRDWPAAFEFIGPLTGGPPIPFQPPEFELDRKHVLVSLGTHIPWAREALRSVIQAVGERMPQLQFHVSGGIPGGVKREQFGNVQFVDYFPYEQFLPRYAAAIVHGGTGLVYSCIRSGVPMLVAPQDFDQFDHAARIVHRNLGIAFSLRESPVAIVRKLNDLLADETKKRSIQTMQACLTHCNPHQTVADRLQTLHPLRS
jgi:UDP:flavonoid glycosyltransferase YjiC (YdhE family)